MNRIATPMAAIGLLLPFTLGGCSGQPSASSAKPRAIIAEPPPTAELWLDKEAAEMLKAVLGYSEWDEVYVIRWKWRVLTAGHNDAHERNGVS